jgi:hypothetical protein
VDCQVYGNEDNPSSSSSVLREMRYKAKLKGPQGALSSQKKQLLDELGFNFTNQQQKSEAGLLSKMRYEAKLKGP